MNVKTLGACSSREIAFSLDKILSTDMKFYSIVLWKIESIARLDNLQLVFWKNYGHESCK